MDSFFMLPPENTDEHAHLRKLIGNAIEQAQADGEDWLGQNRRAVASVLFVRPYMSEIDASRLVLKLWR